MKRLECKVQKYEWGKIGKESFINKLKHSEDVNEHFAEVFKIFEFSFYFPILSFLSFLS